MASLTQPSRANTWAIPGGCPGQGRMIREYPKPYREHPRTKEGRVAHELGEQMIKAGASGGLGSPDESIIGATFGEDKLTVTKEMYDAATIYAWHVSKCMADCYNFDPQVEHKITAFGSTGYIDCVVTKGVEELHIFDFKFGNTPVEAINNYQLLDYAIAVVNGSGIKYNRVHLHICQPPVNGKKLKTWDITIEQLLDHGLQFELAAADALSAEPTVRVGSHCKYCDARWACVSFQESTLWASEFSGKILCEEPSIEQLTDHYEHLMIAERQVKYALTGIKEQLFQRISGGEYIPNYGYVRTKGDLKWIDAGDAIMAATMAGVDILKPVTPVTPTQADKLGFDATKFSVRSKGALKLEKINYQEVFKDVNFN